MNTIERTLAKMAFNAKVKSKVFRQLQRMIKAGIPLSKSLEDLRKLYSKNGKKPREPLALMVAEWQQSLNSGKSLAIAMKNWINISEYMIIEAGEQSDKLASSLNDALEASNASRNIRNAILGGLAYPAVLVIALCLILYGFSVQIVPTFATIVEPSQWTGSAAIMYSVSEFMRDWLVLIAMIAVGAIVAITMSLPVLTGPIRVYLDKIPPWSIYKITQGASFMISLQGFLAAGLQVSEAMKRMLKTGNPYFRERVSAINGRINMGRDAGQAMLDTGFDFPDDTIAGEVSIYAGLDGFAKNIDMLAKEWIHDSTARAKASSKVMTQIMLVLVAGTIMFIASAMFQLQQLISQSAGV